MSPIIRPEQTIDGQSLTPDCSQYIIAERRPITEPSINKSSWRETAQAGIESVESAMKMNAQWDGEGLPPVGSDVVLHGIRETTDDKFDIAEHCQVNLWRNGDVVKVLMIDDSKTGKPLAVVWNYQDKTACGILVSFLIKIDVARDEAIEAMRDVGYALPAAIRFTKEEMAALYDAGYRKME